MSHQPFENWILDQGALSNGERRALLAHLATCTQCQRLEHRWQSVSQELRARPLVSPAAGFAKRWQAGLAGRRAREQRNLAWRIFGILIGAALFCLLTLAGYMVLTTSPTEWLFALSRTAESSRVFLQMAIYVVQGWLASTPLAVNIALWIYLTLTLCALISAWVLVLWRTKSVGVFNQ
jgi:anti-sigma factor RsiW